MFLFNNTHTFFINCQNSPLWIINPYIITLDRRGGGGEGGISMLPKAINVL